ncbi:flagellar protein FlaG [Gracilibacillus sp. YIM 98692]|uniref:flagellar protein FlaG n=1 Tax=Gracilibacillus sp. YIM 98692 TaxID=2663532 RepID=UPI0013D32573|nr:flagellar protein FlaG [Gracilibacillus sp. YIM 98692]
METSRLASEPISTTRREGFDSQSVNREQRDQESKREEKHHIDISKEEAAGMVDGLNQFLKETNTNIRYEFHDKLDKYYVTIIDSESEEVIKEIPPKKLLDVYASMAELMGFITHEQI